MSWHAAQIGYVIATAVIAIVVVVASTYVISSVTWSDRWAKRQR